MGEHQEGSGTAHMFKSTKLFWLIFVFKFVGNWSRTAVKLKGNFPEVSYWIS